MYDVKDKKAEASELPCQGPMGLKEKWLSRVIESGCKLGQNVSLEYFIEIQEGCVIGDFSVVRSFCRVGAHCVVGEYVTLKCAAILGPHTTLEDQVFIGPQTIFMSDLKTGRTDSVVEEGAFIGAGCLIMPGVRIGAKAFVAAGTLVTRDVEADQAVMGRPMRVMDRSGREIMDKVFGG